MARLDGSALKKVTVYVGEKNYYERQQLRDMFIAQGIKAVVCPATADALKQMLLESPPDMLVLSDDFDPLVFEIIKEIRHQKLGDNPFMLITMLVDPTRRKSLGDAMKAGVDDVVVKPVTSERVRERINLVAFHRQPFIAHGEYVGPDRRTEPHTSAKKIPVLNTLLEKANGKDFDKDQLRAAIHSSLERVLKAQLDSQSSKLGEVCGRAIRAYDSKFITIELQNDLLMLADVLQEASLVAERLRDVQLVTLCRNLSENIVKMADHYDEPGVSEIDLLRKITQAFQMAVVAKERMPLEAAPAPAPAQLPLDDSSPPDGGLDLSVYATATT